MVSSEQIRAIAIGAVTVSLLGLGACSDTHTANQVSPQARVQASKKEAAAKAQQIAKLADEKKAEQKRADDAKKQLSVLLAQSDSAFKIADQYKNMAAKEKNAAKKLELQQRASKAQKVADQKASDLITTHKSIYDSANHVREIDAKIASLTAEKKRAEQLAMGNSSSTPAAPATKKM
jgi:hypothetical protein